MSLAAIAPTPAHIYGLTPVCAAAARCPLQGTCLVRLGHEVGGVIVSLRPDKPSLPGADHRCKTVERSTRWNVHAQCACWLLPPGCVVPQVLHVATAVPPSPPAHCARPRRRPLCCSRAALPGELLRQRVCVAAGGCCLPGGRPGVAAAAAQAARRIGGPHLPARRQPVRAGRAVGELRSCWAPRGLVQGVHACRGACTASCGRVRLLHPLPADPPSDPTAPPSPHPPRAACTACATPSSCWTFPPGR